MEHVRASLVYRLVGLCATALVGLAPIIVASPAAAEGTILGVDNHNAIAGSYLVVYKDGAARARDLTASLADRYGAAVSHVYSQAVRGFAARMSESAARQLAAEPSIAFVEQDAVVTASATQSPTPSWGLDRIDQAAGPLDGAYTYPTTASGVTVYSIDTGIQATHSDFGRRTRWGTNTVDTTNNDCHGHGTHLAGTIGGTSFGVAKGVQLV